MKTRFLIIFGIVMFTSSLFTLSDADAILNDKNWTIRKTADPLTHDSIEIASIDIERIL